MRRSTSVTMPQPVLQDDYKKSEEKKLQFCGDVSPGNKAFLALMPYSLSWSFYPYLGYKHTHINIMEDIT